VVQEHLDTFDTLHFGSHLVLKTILGCLSAAQEKTSETRDFLESHRDDMQSRSALYFLHHPPKPAGAGLGQNIHTDAGTLTLLFTQQPGLQVLSPATNQWEYVVARPGHGIVNVGDTLRFLSLEKFRSALHRVLPLTDEKGAQNYHRYSTAYFLRAADAAVFIGNDGKPTTAEDWFLRKFQSFTQDRSVQRLDSVAFGGMEKSLGVNV
jgi:isopenicillin N synthase-like dioxygenase